MQLRVPLVVAVGLGEWVDESQPNDYRLGRIPLLPGWYATVCRSRVVLDDSWGLFRRVLDCPTAQQRGGRVMGVHG